jgi:ABC-type phosphate transport system substrate-binding protein
MKTINNIANSGVEKLFFQSMNMNIKHLLMITSLFCTMGLQAQKANQTITISLTQFADPLIKKWTSEYAKANSGVTFKFVKNASQNAVADLNLTINKSGKKEKSEMANRVNVGRLAVLPVANAKNTLISKQLKNGIRQEELKKIFLQPDLDGEQTEETSFTVYTQTAQSATANVLSDHFGKPATELIGVTVTGEDKYLIESVLSDSTAVTYSNLSMIYDLNNRAPLQGLKIIPIDLDDNGRLKKDEMIYDNLDQVIIFLESNKNNTVPIDDFSFSYNTKNNNPAVADFVNWVSVSGQQYNHQFGLLKSADEKSSALTQK